MFSLKQVNDVWLLEEELRRLKGLYRKAMKKPANNSSTSDLRRMIKVVLRRITLLSETSKQGRM